jgi:hypothetical protein
VKFEVTITAYKVCSIKWGRQNCVTLLTVSRAVNETHNILFIATVDYRERNDRWTEPTVDLENTLEQTGLATEKSGGKLKIWIPNIHSSILCRKVEETLGLSTGSIKFNARPMHPHKGNRNNPLTTLRRPKPCAHTS